MTLDSREAIEAARNAYDALTEEHQSYVTNYSVLTAAEAELKALEEQAAADAVTEQINSLPAADALTLEDKAAVEAAREAYEALTDAQKQYVTEETMAVLEKCENRIQELESAENPDGPDVTPTPTPDEEVTLTYQNYPISVTGKGLSGWKLRLEALTAFDSDVKLMQKVISS